MNLERLEQTLRSITVDVPEVDLWPSVAGGLTRPLPRGWRSLAAAFALIVLTLFLFEPVRSTVSAWFGFGQTTVTFDGSASLGERTNPAGEAISSKEAESELDGRLPASDLLGEAQLWMVDGTETVSGVWLPSPELPEIGSSGAGAILSIQRESSLKTLVSSDGVEFVMVGAQEGLWLPGPHLLTADDGRQVSTGNVLIWLGTDSRQYRLEVNLDRDLAVDLAESIGTN